MLCVRGFGGYNTNISFWRLGLKDALLPNGFTGLFVDNSMTMWVYNHMWSRLRSLITNVGTTSNISASNMNQKPSRASPASGKRSGLSPLHLRPLVSAACHFFGILKENKASGSIRYKVCCLWDFTEKDAVAVTLNLFVVLQDEVVCQV